MKSSDLVGKASKSFKNLCFRLFNRPCSKHLKYYHVHAKDVSFFNWANLNDFEPENYTLLLNGIKKCDCVKCGIQAYNLIARSVIDVNGYSQKYIDMISAMSVIRQKEIDMWTTGDKSIKNHIKILQRAFDAQFKTEEQKDSKVWDMFYSVESALGFPLDSNRESLLSIYERRNKISEDITRAKEQEDQAKAKAQKGVPKVY